MIEFCCFAILIFIVVYVALILIPKQHTSSYNYTTSERPKKVDGKICIKCCNVSPLDSKYCKHRGNEF